jgi:hypothetical protein
MFEECKEHLYFTSLTEGYNTLYQFATTTLVFDDEAGNHLGIIFYHTARVSFALDWTYTTNKGKQRSSADEDSEMCLPSWGIDIIRKFEMVHEEQYGMKKIFMNEKKKIPTIKRM